MALTVDLILYIAAAICFLLAGLGVTVHPKLSLVAIGLLFWVLTAII